MAGTGQKKRLALDTNLLLDLSRGHDFAHDFRAVFQSAGYALLTGPTVFRELAFAALYGQEPERSLARTAVERAAAWHILPFNLTLLDQSIADRFAEKLLETRLLPWSERNDALILAETSLAAIPLLVTSDKRLLHMDEDPLLLAFNEADLPPVRVPHPKGLLKAIK